MTARRRKKSSRGLPLVVGLALLAGAGYVGYLVATDNGGPRKQTFQNVTLIKPQPEAKEKPPEPEPPKEEMKSESSNQQVVDAPAMAGQAAGPADDGPPAGSDLGVDADGGAGSDAFGLVGRKGGRAITLGGGGGGAGTAGGGESKMSLYARYGAYIGRMQDDIRVEVRRILESQGAKPKGKLHTGVRVQLDADGRVRGPRLFDASGDPRVDNAVLQALDGYRIGDPPPHGMPRGVKLRITTQG